MNKNLTTIADYLDGRRRSASKETTRLREVEERASQGDRYINLNYNNINLKKANISTSREKFSQLYFEDEEAVVDDESFADEEEIDDSAFGDEDPFSDEDSIISDIDNSLGIDMRSVPYNSLVSSEDENRELLNISPLENDEELYDYSDEEEEDYDLLNDDYKDGYDEEEISKVAAKNIKKWLKL